MSNETGSPRPVPSPGAFVVKNGTNSFVRSEAATPGPSSVTVIRTVGPASVRGPRRAVISSRPVGRSARIAWIAFEVRLTRTCWICDRSIATRGRPGSTSMTHVTPPFCEYDWSSRTVSISGLSEVGWRSGGRERTKSRNVRTICPARWASSTRSAALSRRSADRVGVPADERAQPDDRGDRVVELVGDARDEDPDRLHLLGLDELGLEALLLGQVADPDEVAALVAELDPGDLGFARELAPIGPVAEAGEDAAALPLDELERLGPGRLVGSQEVADVASPQLVERQAEEDAGGGVGVDDPAFGVAHDVGVRGRLEEAPVARLGRLEPVAKPEVGERDPDDPGDRIRAPRG